MQAEIARIRAQAEAMQRQAEELRAQAEREAARIRDQRPGTGYGGPGGGAGMGMGGMGMGMGGMGMGPGMGMGMGMGRSSGTATIVGDRPFQEQIGRMQSWLDTVERYTKLARDPSDTAVAAVITANDLLRSRGPQKAVEFFEKLLPQVKNEAVRRAIQLQLTELY
ncbi:MAG TPA: hypothetical protein VHP11_10780, partial [Tepidisphaeraceae bacterium]|nr:hypothetical protein [Tepidisphaeraceae bacterium]